MADLRLVPAACLRVTGRGKEDLDLVLLLNQPQQISSLVHLQFHLRGHMRRTSSGPEDATGEKTVLLLVSKR